MYDYPFTIRSLSSMMSLSLSKLIYLALALQLCACTSMQPSSSGFLKNDAELSAVAGKPQLRFSQTYNLNDKYDGVHLLPLEWKLQASETVTDEDKSMLSQVFTQAIETHFGKKMTMRQNPSNPLHIRAAVTNLKTSSPGANLALSILLIGPLDNGGLSMEIEALEPQTQKRIAAMSAAEVGGVVSTGGFSKLGHAKEAIDKITQQFAEQIK
jgi:hypothetical protein